MDPDTFGPAPISPPAIDTSARSSQGSQQLSGVAVTPQAPPLFPQAQSQIATQSQANPHTTAGVSDEPMPLHGPAVQSPIANDVPQIADDTDLIEKEWVYKAKEIVGRTRNDPYKQNEALHQLKADYMKKRYNKSIKLNNK